MAQRWRALRFSRDGRDVGGARGLAIDCTIRNISPIGAALDVPDTSAIPHEITLLMVDGHLTQHCYVVWRNPSRVGVTFVRLNEPIIDPAPSGIRKPSLR
jgi:hypothetical protein